jgi:hypothetical protein
MAEKKNDVIPWLRKIQVTLGPLEDYKDSSGKGGNVVTFASDGTLNGLRVAVTHNKQLMAQPQPSTVTVYNLSGDTRNGIRRGLTKIKVEAGWENTDMHLVFQGGVMSVIHERNGADAEFDESQHPRDATGKFGSGGNASGKSVEEKRAAVKDAMREIANGKPEATIPDLRNDLEQFGGTNDVTIVRGDKKKGLEHIVERHGQEVVPGVLEAMATGEIRKFVETKKTVHIQKDGFEAVLSLDEHGKKKTWLLTGYDVIEVARDEVKKPSGERGKVSASHAPTQSGPIFSRPGLGADASLSEIIKRTFSKSSVKNPEAA